MNYHQMRKELNMEFDQIYNDILSLEDSPSTISDEEIESLAKIIESFQFFGF